MKITLTNRVQSLIDKLVALDASSRMEAIVALHEDQILVLNTFSTLMLRFPLQAGEEAFPRTVIFFIRDYEGKTILAREDGSMEFLSSLHEYNRRKRCLPPSVKVSTLVELWESYKPPEKHDVRWKKGVLRALDDTLSHVEILPKKDEVCLVQRDVFSQRMVEVSEHKVEGGFIGSMAKGPAKPISIRTADFFTLFAFAPVVTLSFPKRLDYCWVHGESDRYPFSGVISCCLYETNGSEEEGEKTNRKKQARRRLPARTPSA